MNCWTWSVEWLTSPGLARGMPEGPRACRQAPTALGRFLRAARAGGATQGLPEPERLALVLRLCPLAVQESVANACSDMLIGVC